MEYKFTAGRRVYHTQLGLHGRNDGYHSPGTSYVVFDDDPDPAIAEGRPVTDERLALAEGLTVECHWSDEGASFTVHRQVGNRVDRYWIAHTEVFHWTITDCRTGQYLFVDVGGGQPQPAIGLASAEVAISCLAVVPETVDQ